jgi:two-component system, OmpR family, KDP operon response regulator KdpE
MTVVLIDLDEDSRRMEVAALRYGGYDVHTVQTVRQAIKFLRNQRGDAILIDPAPLDAVQLLGELRAQTDVPVLVMTEVADEPDVVVALDAGADDFMAKPVGVEELLARLRAALRRVQSSGEAPIVTDDFTIDVAARRAFHHDGSEILLTGVEFRLIEVLLRQPGHLVSREQLLKEVWGPRAAKHPNYLRVFTNRIRQKIEPDPAHPRYLRTASGLGLVFDVDGRSGPVH